MLINANALHIPLADKSVHCVVTSPPYWGLRDYGVGGQLGLERTPEEYVANMVQVFRECWRVLRDDGTLWLNIGDSYAGGSRDPNPNGKQGTNKGTVNFEPGFFKGYSPDGLKPKDLVGIPWRVAFALQADGWYLRSDIIWAKPNPMPESVTDRPTKAHEYLFLLAKQPRYYYDADAVREEYAPASLPRALMGLSDDNKWSDGAPGSTAHTISQGRPNNRKEWEAEHGGGGSGFEGHSGYVDANGRLLINPAGRNRRTVWTIPTAPYSGAHFATYPPALVEPCIKAGTSERGVCPECGKGWRRVTELIERHIGGGTPQASEEDITLFLKTHGITHHSREGLTQSTKKTLGWQPACTCDAGDPVPATVFDPFAGSGTTLMVARSLGRRGVGLDLSYRYLYENARTRLELDKLAAWHNGAASSASELSDLPMFAEVE